MSEEALRVETRWAGRYLTPMAAHFRQKGPVSAKDLELFFFAY
jgi:hypothetical protein